MDSVKTTLVKLHISLSREVKPTTCEPHHVGLIGLGQVVVRRIGCGSVYGSHAWPLSRLLLCGS
jgi:hypothetical protein